MRRAFAALAAVAMVVGAFALRSSLGDDDGDADVASPFVCVADLADVCAAAGVEARAEEAGATADRLVAAASADDLDGATWLTTSAWASLVVEERARLGREPLFEVVGEPLGPPEMYGGDRVFVALRVGEDRTGEEGLRALAGAGHPVIDLRMADRRDLGAQCFLWEIATAVAGWRLAINPFDQPDVEAAKILARRMIAAYREKGAMPPETPLFETPGISVYGAVAADTPSAALSRFLEQAGPGAYAAIQAYLRPSAEAGAALELLRLRLRDTFRIPVTFGYGPRFLHSTGQLHKGDAGRGLFIQLTTDDPRDAPIPDELGSPASALTFGVLKTAQAFGDRQALVNAGRRVIRFHLHGDPVGGIARLAEALGGATI